MRVFAEFRPDVVGFSAHGVDAPAMHRLAIAGKYRSLETPVVCRGAHGTMYWEETARKAVIDRRLNVGITVCIGARADLATDESLDLVAQAGVYCVMVAIETVSPRLRETMAKNLDLERTRDVIRRLSGRGITMHAHLISVSPAEIRQTVR
jgi:hypothetical protein